MPHPLFFSQDYRLVVVGHSLGGGVAAILSVLIKMHEKAVAPRLKSFGYSTPGCVFRSAADYGTVMCYRVIFMSGYKCCDEGCVYK